MKKLLAVIITMAMALSLALPALATNEEPDVFSDISGHWARTEILSAHKNGFVKGYPNGTFKPNEPVTRAEAVAIINAFFKMTTAGDVAFSDVSAGDWFYQAVSIAVGNEYVGGVDGGRFLPNAKLTRLHFIFMAHRILGYPKAEDLSVTTAFKDAAAVLEGVSPYAGAVAYFIENSILGGYPDDTLRLNGNITRAELLVLLNRVSSIKGTDIGGGTVPLAPLPIVPTPAPVIPAPVPGPGGGGGGDGGGGGGPVITPPPVHTHSWGDWEVTTPATCTLAGMETRICATDTTHVETRVIEALGHAWGDWITVTPATCTLAGEETRTCATDATHVETRVVEALGHAWGDWITVTPATCEEDGEEIGTCANDETHTMTRVIEALGHAWGDWITVTPATCEEDGEETGTCANDETHTLTRVIEALGHAYETVVTAPTCLEAGFTTHTCSRCSDFYTDNDVPALGHAYETVVTAPTCLEAGFTTYTCTRCGDTYTGDNVPALGHAYETVVTAPTCLEAGFTTHTCSRCSDSFISDNVPALGHDWGPWVVTTPPTFDADGEETRTCANDPTHTETRVIPATGHTWGAWIVTTPPTCVLAGEETRTCDCEEPHVQNRPIEALGHAYETVVTAPTCETAGFTTFTCTRCGDTYTDDELPALGHAWDDGVITLEPTRIDPGVVTYTCFRCGEERTEEIPALGHTLVEEFRSSYTSDYSGGGSNTRGTINHTFTFVTLNGFEFERKETRAGIAEGTINYSYDYVIGCNTVTVSVSVVTTRSGSVLSFNVTVTHSTNDPIISKTKDEPTCEKEGLAILCCAECDEELGEETIPIIGHVEETIRLEATCEEDGYIKVSCVFCGHVISNTVLEATGHDWDEGVVTKPATEEEDGIRLFTCKTCKATREETFPYIDGHTEHDYVPIVTAPTCETAGYTTHTCSVCGNSYITDNVPALGHDWDAWVVTTWPTCETGGEETRTCANDATHTETRTIDPIGHNYVGVISIPVTCTKEGQRTYTCLLCGDSYNEAIPIPEGHIAVEEMTVSYSAPTYTGSGSNRVGATNVTMTFTLTGESVVVVTQPITGVNSTRTLDYTYEIGCYKVTVSITVTTTGNNNSMIISNVTAQITGEVLNEDIHEDIDG